MPFFFLLLILYVSVSLCVSFIFLLLLLLLLLCRLLFRSVERRRCCAYCARLAATWLLSVVSICYLYFKCKRAICVYYCCCCCCVADYLLMYTRTTIEATCMIFFALLLILLLFRVVCFAVVLSVFLCLSLILFRLSRARTYTPHNYVR